MEVEGKLTAAISMIVIKHFKQEVGRSVLDICLDKEIPNLLAILPTELEKCFYPKFGDKNLFRAESDHTEALLLDVMKYLRLHKWNLLTSNSFAHLSLEKTVESHFYFEKILKSKSTEEEEEEEEEEEQEDDEKVKAFAAYLKHQFEEYEFAKLKGADRRQFSDDSDPLSHGVHQPKHSSPMGAQKPIVPPEVMALIMEKSTQQTGPYGFAKRSAAAGLSPTRRPLGSDITENFSKAQRDIVEGVTEAHNVPQFQVGETKPTSSLPPLPPGTEKKTAPNLSSRMVEKYQPDRKAVAGISPKLTIQANDLDHDADVSNFYEAKNEISELNPLHGSTSRGITPVSSLTEATVQPQTLSPINVPAPVIAPTPVLVPIASPLTKITPTLSVDVSTSISHVASAPVTIPSPTERSVPSPVPTPNASSEPTLARQPSAADKLLSKYRRKSSFSVSKSPTGNSATAIASQIQAEEALKGATTSGPIPPVTDHPTIAAAAAAAAAKRSSATSATLSKSATSPKEHATLGIAVVDTPSALVDANVTSGSASNTPKKRTSFFALQSGGSPRDTKSAVVESATPITSLLQQETNSAIPDPPLSVAVTVDVEKTVDESSKKSPTSVTPTSSTSSSTGKSFLSRYATKKRSITSGSGNNLKAELQQAKDVFAVDAASSMAPVQPEGPSPSVEQKSSLDASIHVPTIAPLPTTVASTALHLPIVDILQSLPEIPPPSSSSHTTNETSFVPFKEESMSSPPAAVVPPPPAAESVLAMLEAATSPTATSRSLAENVNKPFAGTQIEETYESESKESSIPERKRDAVDEPIPIEIVMSASSMEDHSTVPSATVGEPVPIAAFTPSTSAPTAVAIGTAPAPAPAPATAPVAAPASQDFEVEYAEKLHIASASSLMRQIASSKQGDNSPEVQQHESEKTNHYSKLGSAFVTSNVLGRGAARGGGRGRGRGL